MPNELEHMAATFTGPGQREAVTRLLNSLSKFPDSPRALPALVGFSALLMGTLFFVRINPDLNYDGEISYALDPLFGAALSLSFSRKPWSIRTRSCAILRYSCF